MISHSPARHASDLIGGSGGGVSGRSLPRREMLHRLALLGAAAGVSSSLLAACGGRPGSTAPLSSGAVPPGRGSGTAGGSDVHFAGPSGPLRGVWAAPAGKPRAGVLLVHDNQGLTDHFVDLVGRFAGAGYGTLCVDLLSAQGGSFDIAALIDPARASVTLAATPPWKLLSGLRAGIDELARRVPGVNVGAVGFGFGGDLLWQLLAIGEPRLAAAVPFYGVTPRGATFSGSHAWVLAIYAQMGKQIIENQDKADEALRHANLGHTSISYPGAEKGFFDDTGPRYNPDAAGQAWRATLDWFNQHLQ